MPMNDLLHVHHFEAVPGLTGKTRLVKIDPYLRLTRDEQTVFVKAGRVLDASGFDIEAPVWFEDELKKCSPAALAECGWAKPTTSATPPMTPPAKRFEASTSKKG